MTKEIAAGVVVCDCPWVAAGAVQDHVKGCPVGKHEGDIFTRTALGVSIKTA